jgi:hypothetical protein
MEPEGEMWHRGEVERWPLMKTWGWEEEAGNLRDGAERRGRG